MESIAANIDGYRYERKFVISNIEIAHVESLIKYHPALFIEKYPPRYVNNIYFDTLGAKSFYENIDGTAHRCKMRLRWYGPLFGYIEKPILEFKIKNGLVGRKESFVMPAFTSEPGITKKDIHQLCSNAILPEQFKMKLLDCEWNLINHYFRKYFQSSDGAVRITIDTDVTSYRPGVFRTSFNEHVVDDNIIIELKYDKSHVERAYEISNILPFRMTKNSKYVNGIIGLYF